MHHNFGSDHGDSGGSGEKRPFEKVMGDNIQGAPTGDKRQKLPALASVVVEAVKMELCSSLEPILHKVVGEVVERVFARLVPNRIGARTTPRQIQESPVSDLCLDFITKLSLPLFTGGKVEGEGGLPIYIVLKDGNTGQVLKTGSISTAMLEVVVLDGDFANDDDEWTAEEFENHVVKERDGKRPLLTGDLNVTLKEGVGTLGDLSFTDNSSWIRSRKFRLGVRIVPGFREGVRIKECKSDAFIVKDHRGELYKKHYPPRLHDEVWRLDKIRKDGAFHTKLQLSNIKTVEDFLRWYIVDQQKLRSTLGRGMSNKMWEATVDHAKMCGLSDKLFVFYADSSQNVGVIFNNIYELMGVTSSNTFKSAELLTDTEKEHVDKLVKVAYENLSSITEYEKGTLASEATNRHSVMHNDNEVSSAHEEQAVMYRQPVGLPQQPGNFRSVPNTTSISASGSTPQLYGYGAEPSPWYPNQDNQVIQSNQSFSPGTSLRSHASPSMPPLPPGSEHANTGLDLGPFHGGYSAPASLQPIHGSSAEWQCLSGYNPMTPFDTFINEKVIPAMTSEMLGSEDMQQLLGDQYLSHPETLQLQGGDIYFSGFAPSPAVSMPYSVDGVPSFGKAYVRWPKLKAALRWCMCIRKVVAENASQRALLEEIEV